DNDYVLAAKIKNCGHKIMARSLLAQLHFEALFEKRLKAIPRLRSCEIGKVRPTAFDMRGEFAARLTIVLTGQANPENGERSQSTSRRSPRSPPTCRSCPQVPPRPIPDRRAQGRSVPAACSGPRRHGRRLRPRPAPARSTFPSGPAAQETRPPLP